MAHREDGAALVEAAIVLPLLLLITAGLFNFASAFWQVQVLSEAIRHGARVAATHSNEGLYCSTVIAHAKNSVDEYIEEYSNANNQHTLKKWWNSSFVCFNEKQWDSVYSEKFITVSMTTNNQDNCIFCYANFYDKIGLSLSSSFKLEWPCAGGDDYRC